MEVLLQVVTDETNRFRVQLNEALRHIPPEAIKLRESLKR